MLLGVTVPVKVAVGVGVSLGVTVAVFVKVGVEMGVRVGTCAMEVSSGVGEGVRVGAMVGVTSGTARVQAVSSIARTKTTNRYMIDEPFAVCVWVYYNQTIPIGAYAPVAFTLRLTYFLNNTRDRRGHACEKPAESAV